LSEETDQTLKELGYEPAKSKVPQPRTSYVPQGRDAFQTPNYAVDLLIPFIPKNINMAWEPAAGGLKIVHRLLDKTNLDVIASDVYPFDGVREHNFIDSSSNDYPGELEMDAVSLAIITNPPFSLKIDFYEKCLEYNIPFALLIPADYAGWNINACKSLGCEKIIPTRRIDYITPSGLSGASGHTADFHSMWLTWGFGLGKTETFVELSLEDKKLNI